MEAAPTFTPIESESPSPFAGCGAASSAASRGPLRAPPPTAPLTILHFNDVYNLPSETAGAARFATLLATLRASAPSPPLTTFAGDCLSPSLLSVLTRGTHMPPVLNACAVDVACVGNHDLDFGVAHFRDTVRPVCNFPWLLSNLDERVSREPLGCALRSFVREAPGGWRVGFMGLVEEDWTATLATVSHDAIA
jgi:2',3'-cyclic-nucleotide 2'-phosphodiesterase (5'-nucleotidase family)